MSVGEGDEKDEDPMLRERVCVLSSGGEVKRKHEIEVRRSKRSKSQSMLEPLRSISVLI